VGLANHCLVGAAHPSTPQEEAMSEAMSEPRGVGGGQDPKPLISLAMMVKDEEEMLPACLESIAPYVDEIVVVDTGSTDRTVEIAASYGAKVYHHPWQRHFSLHRNQSIGYCTGEWVFILDADEELKAGSGEVLRRAAAEATSDAVSAVVHSIYDFGRGVGCSTSHRLVRNNGRIHYEGRVHNLLVGYQSAEMWPIHIFHKGYNLGAETQQAKYERTSTLLKEDIAEDPTRPRPHHYLAASYLSRKRWEDALAEAGEAIRLAETQKDGDDLYIWTHYLAAAACAELGRKEEATHWCQAALKKRPNFYDANFVLTHLAVDRADWETVFTQGRRYLELSQRYHQDPTAFGQLVLNTACSQWKVWHYLGVAASEMGRSAEAEEAFAKALAETPDKAFCLRLRGRYYGWGKHYGLARDFFQQSLELKPDDPEVLMNLAATWHGEGNTVEERRTLERLLSVRFMPKAAARLAEIEIGSGGLALGRSLLERVVEEEPENVSALINLGLCLRKTGEPAAAIEPLSRACDLDPASVTAQGNLAEALYKAGDPRTRGALERATEVAPGLESADLRVKLCRVCLAEGDTDGLVRHCEALLRLSGLSCDRSLETSEDLGELFGEVGAALLGGKQRQAAAEALRLAGELAPGLRHEIAGLLRERGLLEEALGQLERSLAITPCKETLLEMGHIYAQAGLSEAASLCQREAAGLPVGEGETMR
jgi:tetratricopeptide (TPR) repeat protein